MIFNLLGGDKPFIESLQPNRINQEQALGNQFKGMSAVPFDYADFESTRTELIEKVNKNFSHTDREFLLSFESGSPDWGRSKQTLQNLMKGLKN